MDNPVYKLLIVEDDLGIAQAIQTQASLWNFDVRIVENFRDVTGEVTSFSPHIILLDIIMAMNLGADDFVAKPFDLNVLLAKIQALLRRSYDFAPTSNVLAHRGALLDLNDHTLSFNGEDIPLTKNEYRILSCLMEQKGKVISREKLMERLWETDQFVDENTLTVNINRLRKKLDSAGLIHFITTKFGVGYLIES